MTVECPNHSAFREAADIVPLRLVPEMTVAEFVEVLGGTCFEARNIARGAALLRRMIEGRSCIWLGIAGAGIAGGLGGAVSALIANGFVDVICTTGAQAYHDLHFAFGLPVKAISPNADDERLRRLGDTRIYDIGVREQETLQAQDDIICRFIDEWYDLLRDEQLSSPRFMMLLGEWVAEYAPHPDRSFVATAALARVPVFWDSLTNHSIALNVARMQCDGYQLEFSPQEDILLSAALVHGAGETGFVELGGGGPKNFIQQTGPTISQMLQVKEFQGVSRGLQISTADVREGGLSGCSFGEAVTWRKYESVDDTKLVQIWGEYSAIFPMLVAYVLDRCKPRRLREVYLRMPDLRRALLDASGRDMGEQIAPCDKRVAAVPIPTSENPGQAG